MRTTYDVVGHDDIFTPLYQLKIHNVNGAPLHVGPKVRLKDGDAVNAMINMAVVIAGMDEPVYRRQRNPFNMDAYQAALQAAWVNEEYWRVRDDIQEVR